MKKHLLMIIVLFLITGCSKDIKTEVYSNIEQNNDEFISINYPETNIRKLNNFIKKDINKTKEVFNKIDNKEKELNIDYTYNVVNNNYINITLREYISYNDYQKETIDTYVFDKSKNRLLEVSDLIDSSFKYKNEISEKFIFNEDYITFFFIQNNKIVEKKLELSNEDSKIKIQKKEENTTINYQAVDKTIDSNKPIIALTFDDGPSKYTKPIIDLLKQYNCNATFFVLGNKVKIYKETIIESINLGNEIGNHSYNHKWLSRLKVEELKEQINKTQNILKEEVNYTPILLRPTYGSVNKKIRNNTNLEIVLWNVDTLDWKIKSSKKIVERALSQIKDRSIILMHDTHERTYEALKIMIPKLIDEGYQFVTISELKKINKLSNMEDR